MFTIELLSHLDAATFSLHSVPTGGRVEERSTGEVEDCEGDGSNGNIEGFAGVIGHVAGGS
jgi:hypothetical protein